MSVTVRLATPLRAAAGGNATITLEAADLTALTREIADRYPELASRVLRDGTFGRFVNVFIDGEDVRFFAANGDLSGKSTVEILPAMSGGAVAPLPEQSARREHEVFGSFIDETIGIVARQTRDTVSFAVGSPSREALELVGADDLTATVLRREGASALGYGITEGEPELRAVVAAGASARGLETDASDVLISAGALQAIDLACRVYLRPGDAVVVESPGFANALSAFRNHGATVLEVPVDGEGLDVGEASRLIRRSGARPRMFFVVPNFQNPSGETLSLARRELRGDRRRRRSVRAAALPRRGPSTARVAGIACRCCLYRDVLEDVPARAARRLGHRRDRHDPAHGEGEANDGLEHRHARAAHRPRVPPSRWRGCARRALARALSAQAGPRARRARARVRGDRRHLERPRRRLLLLGTASRGRGRSQAARCRPGGRCRVRSRRCLRDRPRPFERAAFFDQRSDPGAHRRGRAPVAPGVRSGRLARWRSPRVARSTRRP